MYKIIYRIDSETYPWRNTVLAPSDLRICEIELVTSITKLETVHEFYSHNSLTPMSLGEAIDAQRK